MKSGLKVKEEGAGRALDGMSIMQKEDYLELGRLYVKEGKPQSALKNLHRALLMYLGIENAPATIDNRMAERLPPDLLSYYGLCIAIVEKRVHEGILLCQNAIAKDLLRPDYYLNLGRVYLESDQKAKALGTFRRGLEMTERNSDLVRELKKFGTRQKPVLDSLPRDHLLNRTIGRMLHRATKKSDPKKKPGGRRSNKW
jgi:tetratricopeptide (TPR) repeat protein